MQISYKKKISLNAGSAAFMQVGTDSLSVWSFI